MPMEQRKQRACVGQMKKLLLMEKHAAYSILCAHTVLEHLSESILNEMSSFVYGQTRFELL